MNLIDRLNEKLGVMYTQTPNSPEDFVILAPRGFINQLRFEQMNSVYTSEDSNHDKARELLKLVDPAIAKCLTLDDYSGKVLGNPFREVPELESIVILDQKFGNIQTINFKAHKTEYAEHKLQQAEDTKRDLERLIGVE